MKTCPMCLKDDLNDAAKRCPHCGSWQSAWRRSMAGAIAALGGASLTSIILCAGIILVGLFACSAAQPVPF